MREDVLGTRIPTSGRNAPGALSITATTPERITSTTVRSCEDALTTEGSVGLIAADADIPALHRALDDAGLRSGVLDDGNGDTIDTERLVCVPASLAKGLEFETVIVVEPAHVARAEPRGLHRLYVVLTRAVSALRIVHAEPLPQALKIR